MHDAALYTKIESRTEKLPETPGCWIWLGATSGKIPYGTLMIQRKRVKAHRAMYAATRGPFPSDLLICHHCDVPLCVRPDHLFLGTTTDNMRDASDKGRVFAGREWHDKYGHLDLSAMSVAARRGRPECWRRGTDHYAAKLTEDQVREIRHRIAAGEHYKSVARDYAVSAKHVWGVGAGKAWRHVA